MKDGLQNSALSGAKSCPSASNRFSLQKEKLGKRNVCALSRFSLQKEKLGKRNVCALPRNPGSRTYWSGCWQSLRKTQML